MHGCWVDDVGARLVQYHDRPLADLVAQDRDVAQAALELAGITGMADHLVDKFAVAARLAGSSYRDMATALAQLDDA